MNEIKYIIILKKVKRKKVIKILLVKIFRNADHRNVSSDEKVNSTLMQ